MREDGLNEARDGGPEIERGESAEEPAYDEAQPEARPIRAFLLRFPVLSGLVLGSLLGGLMRFLAGEAVKFIERVMAGG